MDQNPDVIHPGLGNHPACIKRKITDGKCHQPQYHCFSQPEFFNGHRHQQQKSHFGQNAFTGTLQSVRATLLPFHAALFRQFFRNVESLRRVIIFRSIVYLLAWQQSGTDGDRPVVFRQRRYRIRRTGESCVWQTEVGILMEKVNCLVTCNVHERGLSI